jgi:hypothetical protein
MARQYNTTAKIHRPAGVIKDKNRKTSDFEGLGNQRTDGAV